MKWQWLVWTVVVFSCVALPSWGQTKPEEAESLRQQIQALEEKLSAVEKSGMERRRITQLGTSRVKEKKEEEPTLVVRVYDLSDLFSLALPYPALRTSDLAGKGPAAGFFPGAAAQPGAAGVTGAMGMGGMGGMGGVGGGFYSVRSGSNKPNPSPIDPTPPSHPQPGGMVAARTSIDDFIDAITSTIAPTEWDEVGGPGSIAPLGNSLIISTTERNHEQITALLDSLRERWKTLRTISIEAHWLWLTEVQLASLVGPSAKAPAKPDQPRAYGLVDDKAWTQILEEIHREGNDRPAGYHAVVTCYNGQTVYCVSGGQSPIVIGMIPVVGGSAGGEAAGVGYQPEVSTIHQGAVLQLTPITSTSGQFVTLDVHSRVVRAEVPKPAKGQPMGIAPEGPLAVAAALDRPLLMCHQLETTLRAPVERRMLVGGMTYEIQPNAGEPNLYLFIKAVAQELRDDQPPAKAESKPGRMPGMMPGAMPQSPAVMPKRPAVIPQSPGASPQPGISGSQIK